MVVCGGPRPISLSFTRNCFILSCNSEGMAHGLVCRYSHSRCLFCLSSTSTFRLSTDVFPPPASVQNRRLSLLLFSFSPLFPLEILKGQVVTGLSECQQLNSSFLNFKPFLRRQVDDGHHLHFVLKTALFFNDLRGGPCSVNKLKKT